VFSHLGVLACGPERAEQGIWESSTEVSTMMCQHLRKVEGTGVLCGELGYNMVWGKKQVVSKSSRSMRSMRGGTGGTKGIGSEPWGMDRGVVLGIV
jgi:hypothetical protein